MTDDDWGRGDPVVAGNDGDWGKGDEVISPAPSFYERNAKPFAMEVAKGVPIAGAYVPQTPGMTAFEQNHPHWAKGANYGGTALGVGAAATAAPEAFGINAAYPFLVRLLAGSASNGLLSRADASARGASPEDADRAGKVGMATGLAPALLGRVVNPGMGPQTAEAIVDKGIPWAATLAGAGKGVMDGDIMPALEGLIAGGVSAAPTIANSMKGYLTRTGTPSVLGPAAAQTIQPSQEQVERLEQSPLYRGLSQALTQGGR